LVLAAGVTAAHAAPLGILKSSGGAGATGPLIEKVHGCHRSAQDGYEGWHRHVGPNCRAVRSGPYRRNPYSPCQTRCQYIGPIKSCERVCR
ncbi:unnamed protein product, partial [Phaeothamnion confervicola]